MVNDPYLQARNVVSTLKVAGVGRRTVGSSSHSVTVVLANKDSGQVPELGHVVSFKDLTLVRGTITIEGKGGGLVAEVLLGKGDTGAQGDLSSDNTVSSKEVGGEHVHGASLASRDTSLASEKLGKDGGDGATTHVGESVAAVGGDDLVLGSQSGLHTDSDGFLWRRDARTMKRRHRGEYTFG